MVVVSSHDAAVGVFLDEAAEKSSPHRKKHVKYRYSDGGERNEERGYGDVFGRVEHTDVGEKESEEHASGVAHENPCRREVVAQETETAGAEDEQYHHHSA